MPETTTEQPQDRQIVRFAGLAVLTRWAIQLFGLVSFIVIARLLSPEDYGLIAAGTLIWALLQTFSDAGFNLTLIREQRDDPGLLNTVWTLQILRSLIIALTLLLGAPLFAAGFNDERLIWVLVALAAAVLIEGLRNTGFIAWEKQLDFRYEAALLLSGRLANFAAALTGALIWQDWRALVGGILAAQILQTLLSYLLHPYRPRFSLQRLGKIWAFSVWMLVQQIGHYIASRSSQWIIGTQNTMDQFGTYFMAEELANMPSTHLTWPMNRAFYAAYARLAEKTAMQLQFLRNLGLMTAFAFPACAGLAVVAEPLVLSLVGPQWAVAAELLPWLCAASLFQVAQGGFTSLYIALGAARTSALFVLVTALFQLVIVLIGFTQAGMLGAVQAMLVATALRWVLFLVMLNRDFQISIATYTGVILRPTLATALMALGVWQIGAGDVLFSDHLGFLVVCGILIYFGSVFTMWLGAGRPDGPEKMILAMLDRQSN